MALSSEAQQTIREEELIRAQAQKDFATQKYPLTAFQKLNAFLESKVGFWLLATVFTGLITSAYGYLQIYLDREKIARQKEIDDSRRDIDVVIRITPMLISNDPKQWQIATIVLGNLVAHKAMDATLALQASSLLTTVLSDGLKPDATPEEIARSNVVGQTLDTRVAGAVSAGTATPTTGSNPIDSPSFPLDNATLPVRLYIHIPSEARRRAGTEAQEKFRAARMIVPGIEMVGQARSPKQAEIRYCPGKVSESALEQVTSVGAELAPPAKAAPLPFSLCTSVRYNHFELWYGRESGG